MVNSAFLHPALDPNSSLVSSLRSFWPAFQSHFAKYGYLNFEAYKAFYQQSDPLHSAILICAFFSAYCYVMQEITGNASQVDGLWTFLPVIYTAHFTFQKYFVLASSEPARLTLLGRVQKPSLWDTVEPRLFLLFVLHVLWSARLTYNAYRRGMFKKGEEDYRWPLLRKSMTKWQWELFTITFIAPAQNVLLAITALPAYLLLTTTFARYKTHPVPHPLHQLTVWDGLLAITLLLNLTIQYVADNQQWVYQNFKRGKDSRERPLQKTQPAPQGLTTADAERGFVTKGLWAYSRHPNFACEQTTWWIFYAFVPLTFLTASPNGSQWYGGVITYAILAPLAMNILFFASTIYSESVSAGKYPLYADYQRRVGMFWPIDTVLRSLYFRLVAPQPTASRVHDNVWGTPATKKRQ